MTTWEFTAGSATRDRIISHAPVVESGGQRLLRQGHRMRLYSWAYLLVALLVVLVALIAANTQAVKLDWLVGSTHASLVWIILASAVPGWLLGIVTGTVVRRAAMRFSFRRRFGDFIRRRLGARSFSGRQRRALA